MRVLDILFPPREDERALRDVSRETFAARLSPRIVGVTRPPTVTLLPFSDPLVRAAIHEAKYHGSAHAFALLAACLADILPDHLADSFHVGRTTSNIMIVPVPLGRERRKERGYNQVEEVVRRAVRELEADFVVDTTLLQRTRETPTQVSLARDAREENMRGAFSAAPALDPSCLYVLIDDVVTTGATFGACIEALALAGAARDRILPIALAH